MVTRSSRYNKHSKRHARKTRRHHRGGSTPTKTKAKSLKGVNELYMYNLYESLSPIEKNLVDNAFGTPKTKRDKEISPAVARHLELTGPGFERKRKDFIERMKKEGNKTISKSK